MVKILVIFFIYYSSLVLGSCPQKIKDKLTYNERVIEFKKFAKVMEGNHPSIFIPKETVYISKNAIYHFLEKFSKDTIEVLLVPSAGSSTGHLALRFEDKVYHIHNIDGLVIDNFDFFINHRYRKHNVYGTVLKISPEQKDKLINYIIEKTSKNDKKFNILTNNCSLTVCKALKEIKTSQTPKLLSFDPFIAHAFEKKNPEKIMNTVYNPEKRKPLPKQIIHSMISRSLTSLPKIIPPALMAYLASMAIENLEEKTNRRH